MTEYLYSYRIKGKEKFLKHSCPIGMTDGDLQMFFGDEPSYRAFKAWMTGQTISVCEGTQYHHNRVHNDYCMAPVSESYQETFPGAYQHTQDSPHDWRCGYDGGYTEDSACKDNPHGFVTYCHDVVQYLSGRPPLD